MATCKNGHYFPDDKAECPYCPKTPQPDAPNSGSGLLRTVVGVPPAFNASTPEPASPTAGKAEAPRQEMPSAMKTQISGIMQSATETVEEAMRHPSADRKLMGWLVTFDRAPMGQDFRLREGRNVIGTAPDCDIRIDGDSNISGRHLTILFRLGEVLFRDELSTNGTFINSNLANEGRLHDGDILRVGNTHLLFRSAQTHHADDIL